MPDEQICFMFHVGVGDYEKKILLIGRNVYDLNNINAKLDCVWINLKLSCFPRYWKIVEKCVTLDENTDQFQSSINEHCAAQGRPAHTIDNQVLETEQIDSA